MGDYLSLGQLLSKGVSSIIRELPLQYRDRWGIIYHWDSSSPKGYLH